MQVTPIQTAMGIILVVLGGTGNAVGMNLWKWSHETETHLPLLQRWRFWLGTFFALILLFTCDALSYAVLPLALIAPFGGLPIIASGLIVAGGFCGVHEPLELIDALAMLATVTGITIVTVVTVATDNYAEPDLNALANETLSQPAFIGLVALAMLASVVWLALHMNQRLRKATIDSWTSNDAAWPMLVSALVASLNAGVQQVFMKVISEVFHCMQTIEGGDFTPITTNWATWAGVCGLLVFGPLSIFVLQLMLGPGRKISLAVPAYQSFTVIITVAVGAYFLRELEVPAESPGSLMLFAAGLLFVIVGLVALSYRQEVKRVRKFVDKEEGKVDEATLLKR